MSPQKRGPRGHSGLVVSTSDCGAGGHGFKSCHHQNILLNLLYTQNKPKNLQRYPVTVSWHKGSNNHNLITAVLQSQSEPLIQEADPHITKLAIEARM